MGAFITALGTVLGQNIATIISIILGGSVLYCAVAPRGRLIIKSAFNWMFSTAANNPKLAEGAYDEKIKQLRGKLRKAEDINQEAHGKLVEAHELHQRASDDYKKFSEKAVILEKRGQHDQALLMAREASQAQIRLREYEQQIPKYEEIAKYTQRTVGDIQWKISEFEQRKQITISNMEKGNFEKDVAETLKGLQITEIDDYIAQIEKKATETKYQALGARMSYETSDVKKLKDAEQSANMIDAESFLQNLLEEKN